MADGDLRRVNNARLKRAMDAFGVDIHGFKQELVGGAGGEYDFYRDNSTGVLYLRAQWPPGTEPVETGLILDGGELRWVS